MKNTFKRLLISLFVLIFGLVPGGSIFVDTALAAAPSGLYIANVSASRVTLGWADNSSDERGFRVFRANNNCSNPFVAIGGDLPANTVSYVDKVQSGSTYCYKVIATGVSGWSNSKIVTTEGVNNTRGIYLNNISASIVSLGWTPVHNAKEYKLMWSNNETCTGLITLSKMDSGSTTYKHTGRTPGGTYCYALKTELNDGSQVESGILPVTTELGAVAPAPALTFSASSSSINAGQSVNLNWYSSNVSSCTASDSWSGTKSTSGNQSISISTPGTYKYSLSCSGTGGTVSRSVSVVVKESTTVKPVLSLEAKSTSQINLSWTKSTNATSYKIYRRKGDCSGTLSYLATRDASVTSLETKYLDSDTTYCYRVDAVSSEGVSPSNQASATTFSEGGGGGGTVPLSPTSLSANGVSSSQINLNWTDRSNNESGFKIYRGNSSCTGFSQIATVGANVTSYSNTGLSSNTTYCYRVRAYNSTGDSSYSNTDTASTSSGGGGGGTVPVAPSNLSVTPSDCSSMNISWADRSSNESGFRIYRGNSSCTGFSQIATVGSNVTVYSDTNLSADTTYCYRVRAYNSAGESGYITGSNQTPTCSVNQPTLTFSSDKVNVANAGDPVRLTWNAVNSSYCSASTDSSNPDEWTGSKLVSGTTIVNPTRLTAYTLTCHGFTGSFTTRSLTVGIGNNGGGGGGGGGGCGTLCQTGETPPPVPTPTPSTPPGGGGGGPSSCWYNVFASPLYQAACTITPEKGANCELRLADGFFTRVTVPANSVLENTNLRILVQNPSNFPNLSNSFGSLRVVGNKIIQILAEDKNCNKVSLQNESVITFGYPQVYAGGLNENTFSIKKAADKDSYWQSLSEGRNISTNIVAALTNQFGYFSLFGAAGQNPPIAPPPSLPPIDFPTEDPTIFEYTFNGPGEVGSGWLGLHNLMGSLAGGVGNFNFSWCQALSTFNLILLALALWLFFGRKLVRGDSSEKKSPILASSGKGQFTNKLRMGAQKTSEGFKSAMGAPQRAWQGYIQKKAMEMQNRDESLSVAPFIKKEGTNDFNQNFTTDNSNDSRIIIEEE